MTARTDQPTDEDAADDIGIAAAVTGGRYAVRNGPSPHADDRLVGPPSADEYGDGAGATDAGADRVRDVDNGENVDSGADDHTGDPGDTPDSDDGAAEPGEPESDGRRKRRRLRLAVAGFAVLTIVLLTLGAIYGWQLRGEQRLQQLRESAGQVASMQAMNLLSVNSDNIEGQLQSLDANATGDFKNQFQGIRQTFARVVQEGSVDSTGNVDDVAVAELTEDRANVLLALSSEVSNAQNQEPEQRNYRIAVDLERKEDRWLVSGMQFVS